MATAEPDRDPRRRQPLDGGRLLAGIGALALLISLFLDWYGPPGDGVTGLDGDGITAWTAFELVDIVLAALALITIAWVIEGIAGSDHPLIDSRVGTAAGPTALVLVVVSIINEPPLMSSFGADLDAGAWVALAGSVVMTIGGLLRHARISITVTPRERPSAEAETRAMAEEPRRPAP